RVEVVEERRAHQVTRLGEHAARDRHVGTALQLAHHVIDLFDRVGKVGVREHAPGTPRHGHPARHRKALAAVGVVAEQGRAVERTGEVGEQPRRVRLAVVIHQHQLGGPALSAHVAPQGFEMRPQAVGTVAHGHDDGQMDRRLGHADKIRVPAVAWVSLLFLRPFDPPPQPESVMRARTLLVSPVLLVAVAPLARAQTPLAAAWDSVAQILQASPPSATGGYYRYGLPRRDITLKIGDVTVSPALALGAWAG